MAGRTTGSSGATSGENALPQPKVQQSWKPDGPPAGMSVPGSPPRHSTFPKASICGAVAWAAEPKPAANNWTSKTNSAICAVHLPDALRKALTANKPFRRQSFCRLEGFLAACCARAKADAVPNHRHHVRHLRQSPHSPMRCPARPPRRAGILGGARPVRPRGQASPGSARAAPWRPWATGPRDARRWSSSRRTCPSRPTSGSRS